MLELAYCIYPWKPANLLLVASSVGLCRIEFIHQTTEHDFLARASLKFQLKKDTIPFVQLFKQLDRYFSGHAVDWQMRLDIREGTDFQRLVWATLCKIPYGQTITYGQLAKEIGKPGASRAVGSANGANPIPIIIPCHRVVAGAGKLGGFGGGLHVKQALLQLEGLLL